MEKRAGRGGSFLGGRNILVSNMWAGEGKKIGVPQCR